MLAARFGGLRCSPYMFELQFGHGLKHDVNSLNAPKVKNYLTKGKKWAFGWYGELSENMRNDIINPNRFFLNDVPYKEDNSGF